MMTYDYIGYLINNPNRFSAKSLGLAVMCYKDKDSRDKIRSEWIRKKRSGDGALFPSNLQMSTFPTDDPIVLPSRNSVLIEIKFTLATPWYSRSEEKFAPIDNMCCKDYLTGLPMVRPTLWKGQFRTLLEQELPEGRPEKAKLKLRINGLFGSDKDDVKKENDCREGRLIFYPTYFDKFEGEVISPHDREKGIALQPIYYEVVPKGTTGVLKMLYFPFDLVADKDEIKTIKSDVGFICRKAKTLLTEYGFSAKKTIGWGIAEDNVCIKWTASGLLWHKIFGDNPQENVSNSEALYSAEFDPEEGELFDFNPLNGRNT
jgi:hypothetical protein